jgi:hypothetical protein
MNPLVPKDYDTSPDPTTTSTMRQKNSTPLLFIGLNKLFPGLQYQERGEEERRRGRIGEITGWMIKMKANVLGVLSKKEKVLR